MDSLHPNQASPGFLGISISTGVLLFFSIICVGLRFINRLRRSELWWDDWAILASLVFGIGLFVNTVLATLPSLGASGYHITQYTVAQLNTWFKICLAGEILYNVTIALSRISVLLFYRRIFSVDGHFLIFMRVMLFCITASCIACIFGLIFTDNPVQAQWNITMPYTTINSKAFYDTTAVLNIFYDLAVYGLVQHKVWQLKVDIRRKALLSGLLILGAFSILASILRLVYLLTLDWLDVTYTITKSWQWTAIEAFLYIICACLPGVYAFFRNVFVNHNHRAPFSKPTGQYNSKGPLVTIGSAPSKFKKSRHNTAIKEEDVSGILNRADYYAICEPGVEPEWHNMKPLDPVRVRTDYQVSRN